MCHVQHRKQQGTRWLEGLFPSLGQGAGLRDPLDGDCIGEGVARWR